MTTEYKRLLAIDPGGTTGIAWRMQLLGEDWPIFTRTETDPLEVWSLVKASTVQDWHWDQVICEKFTGQGHMNTVRVDVIELVGGIRALCYEHGIPFAFRTPQNRKAYQDLAKAWHKDKGVPFMDHQEDALAHLLAWEAIGERERRLKELVDASEGK